MRWLAEAELLVDAHRRLREDLDDADKGDLPPSHILIAATRHCLELSLKLVIDRDQLWPLWESERRAAGGNGHSLDLLADVIGADSIFWTEIHPQTLAAFH